MPLAPCSHCGKTVAVGAPICPHCGGQHPATPRVTSALALVGLLLMTAFFLTVAYFIYGMVTA